jgi:dienelactone hydrolase
MKLDPFRILLGAILTLTLGTAQAAVQSKAIEYDDHGTKLTGHLYWDDGKAGKRPGVVVYHEWWGLNDYAKKRARMLAELGYVAFAADMYGDDKVTASPDQARQWMQQVTVDVDLWRERANLGLAQLKASELVDTQKLAAIGYCFGGGTVLQMAYGGADLKGVVSFHGSLPAAPEEAKGKVKPEILALHGQADAMIPPEIVQNFEAKLTAADANWELISYGGVRHAFTNPDAGKAGIANLKYDAKADARSWARMQDFFAEVFR